jgi:hypothetical protein
MIETKKNVRFTKRRTTTIPRPSIRFAAELQTSVIPKTKADFRSVVIDGQIRTMHNPIQDPMREDGKTDEQRSSA